MDTQALRDEDESVKLWIDWMSAAESVPVEPVNQVIVQHHDGLVFISLFAVVPPVTFGPPDEIKHQVAKLDKLTPNCVARLVVTPKFANRMMETLGEHLEKMKRTAGDDYAE